MAVVRDGNGEATELLVTQNLYSCWQLVLELVRLGRTCLPNVPRPARSGVYTHIVVSSSTLHLFLLNLQKLVYFEYDVQDTDICYNISIAISWYMVCGYKR
jgi:hypothetical protein